jgi:glycosyltransferase involved in cell wall biosynthesis
LIRIYGSVCENAEVIHHAISPISPALTAGQHSLFLDRLPRRYVVYPGNISPQKNHYALFLAWSRFARRKKLPLVLFGDGTEVFRMRRPEWPEHWHSARLVGLLTRCDLRLGEDYFALGYVDDADANALIAHATALIMPSLAEGGGSYPVEEALSMGVPVLCSDIPVMREHLIQRSTRIAWFDPECPASILSALNIFFDNYEDFKESALRGMKDPRPTWDDVAAQYVDVFARVVEATRHANGSS